jgi:sigma-E factor negative regulatory protein RseC
MPRDISHTGTVVEVSSNSVSISFDASSENCTGCSARLLCRRNGDSTGDTVIDVPITGTCDYKVGDKVRVSIPENNQISAVILALILPLVFMFLAVIVLSWANFGDAFVALSALAVVLAYYGVLYIFRNRVRDRYNRMKICHQ